MKVKCLKCGLVLEKCLSLECVCPECGGISWYRFGYKEEIDKTIEELNKIIREWLKQKGYMYFEKMGVPENPYLPESYVRIMKKEEGLAFEIFEYSNGKKVQVHKIYLNGHIEGFKGDPCIVNHIYPKIMALKGLLQQINKDYRDFIEKHLLADLPIDPIEFSKFYQSQLERINNIKI